MAAVRNLAMGVLAEQDRSMPPRSGSTAATPTDPWRLSESGSDQTDINARTPEPWLHPGQRPCSASTAHESPASGSKSAAICLCEANLVVRHAVDAAPGPVSRSVSCESRSLVGAGSRRYRWFLVACGRCLLEPHSMRGRAIVRDLSVFAGWFGLPNDEFLLPWRSISAEQPGGLDTKATGLDR
jgi:hypothetical protein